MAGHLFLLGAAGEQEESGLSVSAGLPTVPSFSAGSAKKYTPAMPAR
jgi:hypothetical protein